MTHYTKQHARQRGSILLMVIGLLTILALLGTSFLFIARLNRKTSQALVATSMPADLNSVGIVARVSAILQEDLYIGASGPYGGITAGSPSIEWKRFVDYPTKTAGSPTGGDEWLSSMDHVSGVWSHVTNIARTDALNVDDVLTGNTGLWDTDGDGTRDARIYDNRTMSGLGEKFWVAVRVIDLGGLINVNTACRPYDASLVGAPNYYTWPIATHPISVDLSSFLSNATIFDNIRAARWPVVDLDPSEAGIGGRNNFAFYDTQVAQRVLAPPPPAGGDADEYLPFAVSDEIFLRWLTTGATSETYIGRFYDATKTGVTPLAANFRRYLTAFNTSRNLVRHPETATSFTEQAPLDTSTPTTRQALYVRMERMLRELAVASAPQSEYLAAKFTANLWAYQDSSANMVATNHWQFIPTSSTIAAYGLAEQDLVITEVYASHNNDPDGDPLTFDWYWASAIEIYNPTSNSVSLTDYELVRNTDVPTNLTGTIGANSRVVIYNIDHGADTDDNAVANTVWGLGSAQPNNTSLNFHNGNCTVRLVRIRYAGTPLASSIPIDQFTVGSGQNLGYSYSVSTPANIDSANVGRVDTSTLYNLQTFADCASRTLGSANNLDATSVINNYGVATNRFPIPIDHSGSLISNLGQLGQIYFTGPFDSNTGTALATDLESFPAGLVDATFTGVFPNGPARGRLDFYPSSTGYLTPVGVARDVTSGWNSGAYPDVPAAAMLAEFFNLVPTDNQRADNTNRNYGKININTAPRVVLEQLPWPATVNGTAVVVNDLVDYIIAYREQTNVASGPQYATNGRATATGITGLRTGTGSDVGGFFTPGEIAIPLAQYAESITTPPTIQIRDELYSAVSNLVTVNSDVYAVYIRVQVGDSDDPDKEWRYIAVIDRSNCRDVDDTPAVLLFSELK